MNDQPFILRDHMLLTKFNLHRHLISRLTSNVHTQCHKNNRIRIILSAILVHGIRKITHKTEKMCRCIDSRAICVMGSFVALVGGVCLAVFSVMTTQPYLFAKDFNEVTCTSDGFITCEYLTQMLK